MSYTITVVGLGASDLDQLPMGIYKLLKQSTQIFARTLEHPVITDLQAEGIAFQSFDAIYEKHDHFDAVYEEIANTLIEKALAETSIVYAVPGHPLVAERTVQLLLEKEKQLNFHVSIVGGQSFLDAMFTAIKVDPIEGFQFLDGTDLHKEDVHISQHVIIAQVYDAFVASDVKLTLMEKYPDEQDVYIVTAAGSTNQVVKKVPLYELDHEMELNNLTSIYVPPIKEEEHTYREFSSARQIIAKLRGPDGCPWDRVQTHQSLKKYLIEEAYELLDAIDQEDDEAIIEELGDVLLQVLLHAQIGEDEGYFSIEDVIASLSEKMVRRHPHVFGSLQVEDSEQVVANWQEIKKQEKGEQKAHLLDEVEKGLPGLLRAYDYQKAAAKVGFDWDQPEEAMAKVEEEWAEFIAEIKNDNKQQQLEELGDVLFALVNVARFYSIHPEEAIATTNQKFYRRFVHVEKRVQESGRSWKEFTLDELDTFWEEAKQRKKGES